MARRNRLTDWRSLKLLRVEEEEATAVSTTRTSIGTGGSGGGGGIDSATTLSLSLDSGEVVSLVDSAYVQLRQDFAYASLTGSPTALSSFTNDTNYLDSTTTQSLINAAYIQANQTTYNTSNFTDSAFVTGLPISTFTNDTNYLDSTTATQLIDSAYVQLRQSASSGGGTDSAAVNILIDAKTQVLDIADIVGSTGNSGQYLKSLGNGNAEWGSVTSSSGLADWQKKSTDYTLSSGDRIAVNTDSAWTLTLPASPTFSDEVYIIDAKGNAAVKNITVSGNGEKILASDSDLIINVNRASIAMMYYGDSQGWILTSTF